MTNIKLLSLSVLTALISFSTIATADEGEKTYKTACFVCHDTAVANAPKLGDKAAWETRIAKGMDALYNTALKGDSKMPAMPPKGGRADLSDDAVKAAVDYMVSKVSDETAEPKKEETTEAPKEEPKKDEAPKTEEKK